MPIYLNTSKEHQLEQAGDGGLYRLITSTGREFLHPMIEAQSTTAGAYFTAPRFGTSNGAVLASGTVHLTPIRLPAGLVITKIGYVSATTAIGA